MPPGDVPTASHLAANLRNWESRVPVHVPAYGLKRYVTTPRCAPTSCGSICPTSAT